MAVAPIAMVSALRETSILFAALISHFSSEEGLVFGVFVSAGLIGHAELVPFADKP